MISYEKDQIAKSNAAVVGVGRVNAVLAESLGLN
jgi:hypothetical protein